MSMTINFAKVGYTKRSSLPQNHRILWSRGLSCCITTTARSMPTKRTSWWFTIRRFNPLCLQTLDHVPTRGHETCRGVLKDKYVRSPRTPKAWKSIAKDFQEIWNLLHYIGAIDGKHVAIKSPLNSGSSYFNYKGILALFWWLFVMLILCFHAQ